MRCSIEGCLNDAEKRGWCGAHYRRWRIHGDPNHGGPLDSSPNLKIEWLLVTIRIRTDECILWPFDLDDGYGYLHYEGKKWPAHRLALHLTEGPPPAPHFHAAHGCGNGPCINHAHLRWATPAENEADKLLHDRHVRGERNPRARLTLDQAQAIYDTGATVSLLDLASEYGVSQTVISGIQRGHIWPEVKRPNGPVVRDMWVTRKANMEKSNA